MTWMIARMIYIVYHHVACSSKATITYRTRKLGMLISGSRRQISVTQHTSSSPAATHHGKCELDSHADTIVAGKNCVVLSYTGQVCDVTPYREDYNAICNVSVAQVATAWQSDETGQVYILVFNEALDMTKSLDVTLVNPNQLRHYGIHVQDDPSSNRPLSIITEDAEFAMPLSREGTIIFATTHTPSQKELEQCPHIILSSHHTWTPGDVRFNSVTHSLEEEVERVRRVKYVKRSSPSLQQNSPEIFDLSKISRQLSIMSVGVESKNDVNELSTFESSDRHTDVTASDLSQRWLIPIATASKTLKETTQIFLRSAILPLTRRYRADRMFSMKTLDGQWSTDTIDSNCGKSLDGNRYAQVFSNKNYYAKVYPIESKDKAGDALHQFCNEVGVPKELIFDGSREQCKKNTKFMQTVRKYGINYHISEPHYHNQNPVEGVVRELRRKWYRTMVRNRVPKKLWDYGIVWISEIHSMTHTSAGNRLKGAIPLERVTGDTVDISEYLDFGFYDKVWYKDNAGLSPAKPGRWLGVSHRTGRLMCYHVLTQTGQVISRSSVTRVTNLEAMTENITKIFEEYDNEVHRRINGNENAPRYNGKKPNPESWSDMLDSDEDFRAEFDQVFNSKDIPEADDFTPEVMNDTYLNMELALPRDSGGPTFAKVTKRLRDANGIPIGTANDNPLLDTRIYEVEFMDGHSAALSANAIARKLIPRVIVTCCLMQ